MCTSLPLNAFVNCKKDDKLAAFLPQLLAKTSSDMEQCRSPSILQQLYISIHPNFHQDFDATEFKPRAPAVLVSNPSAAFDYRHTGAIFATVGKPCKED